MDFGSRLWGLGLVCSSHSSSSQRWGLGQGSVQAAQVLPQQPWQAVFMDLALRKGTFSCLSMFGAFVSAVYANVSAVVYKNILQMCTSDFVPRVWRWLTLGGGVQESSSSSDHLV